MKNSKAMDLFHDIHGKRHGKLIKNLNIDSFGNLPNDFQFVVIRLPSAWGLKLMTRALLLALVIVSLPWLNTIISMATSNLKAASEISGIRAADFGSLDPINAELLPLLFADLANEGLLRMGDRALIVANGDDEDSIFKTRVITDYNMDMIASKDSEPKNSIPDEMYDFIFVNDFHGESEFIERTLKKDGVVIVQLSDNPVVAFQKPSNYKIVYLRRFDTTIIAMKKLMNEAPNAQNSGKSATGRRLLGLTTDVKKEALNNLEDVLLEPPRAASGKSSTYKKRTRYLPDLIKVPLDSYPRRVFIEVGLPDKNEASGDSSWFSKNYPTKNTEFEMYKIETVTEEPSKQEVAEIGMSDWLRKNVKENEYVVMKAEAQFVEDLVRSKAINLVDELFMECEHRGIKKSVQKYRKAYWECLALYGSLRDEGIAVHQWWG